MVRGQLPRIGRLLRLALIGAAVFFIFIFAVVWLSIVVGLSVSMPFLTQFFPDHEILSVLGVISFLFVIGLPILGVVLSIVRLVFHRRIGRPWAIGLGVLWTVSFFSFVSIGGRLGQEFVQEEQVEKGLAMPDVSSDTLTLAFLPDANNDRRFHFGTNNIELPGVAVHYRVGPSADAQWHLTQATTARGYRKAEAQQLATDFVVPIQWEQDRIVAPREIDFADIPKWRNQRAVLDVQVPVGKYVRFDSPTVAANTRGKMDNRTNGSLYRISAGGILVCQDCTAATVTEQQDNRQESQYKEFNKIEMTGPMKVTISKGDRYDVQITGDKEYLGQVSTTQTDDRLRVALAADKSKSVVRVYITLPNLEELRLEGTDDVLVKGFEGGDLNIAASGDFELKTEIRIQTLHLTANEGVSVEFTGSAQELNASLNNGSRLDTDRGKVATARLVARGGSRVKISKSTKIEQQDFDEDSVLRLFE